MKSTPQSFGGSVKGVAKRREYRLIRLHRINGTTYLDGFSKASFRALTCITAQGVWGLPQHKGGSGAPPLGQAG